MPVQMEWLPTYAGVSYSWNTGSIYKLNEWFSLVSELSDKMVRESTLLMYVLIVRISRSASPMQNIAFSMFSVLAAGRNSFIPFPK